MPEDFDRPNAWRKRIILTFLALLVLFPLLFAGWAWITLHYSYARGERAGYVQKISKKGWLCKTWEGELAMANLPGTMPQIFQFTVRDEAVAHQIVQNTGERVAITYEQHRGVPSSCFGETEYFVTQVTPVRDNFQMQAPTTTPPPAAAK